jgi:hypothetical protein
VQSPTATSGNTSYPVTVSGAETNFGDYTATAALATANNNISLQNETQDFTIAKLNVNVLWTGETFAFTYSGEPVTITATSSNASYPITLSNNTETNFGEYTATAALATENNNISLQNETQGFTIAKAPGEEAPGYAKPTTLTAKDNQTLADVELPEGWAWDAVLTTAVGATGERTHKATFTPTDTDNYTTVTKDWEITVETTTHIIVNPYGLKIFSPYSAQYYNLHGQLIGTTKPTTPGVYIERQGRHAQRITVK